MPIWSRPEKWNESEHWVLELDGFWPKLRVGAMAHKSNPYKKASLYEVDRHQKQCIVESFVQHEKIAALSRCSIENPFAGQVEVPLEVEEAPQRYSLERAGWFHWISTFQQHERVKTKSNVPHFVFEEAHPKITKEASQDETTFQVSWTSPGLLLPSQKVCEPKKASWHLLS